jgi:hypothetical protein
MNDLKSLIDQGEKKILEIQVIQPKNMPCLSPFMLSTFFASGTLR